MTSQTTFIFALICLSVGIVASQNCGFQQTIVNEGIRECCYYDTKNIPTIGIGFNLQRSDASAILSKFGLRLSSVLNGCTKKTPRQCLTNDQALAIFKGHYAEGEKCADAYVKNMPASARAAIVDMALNMGCNKLDQFKNMKAALVRGDYKQAAVEAKNSKWCKDVKETRCNSDATCIASAATLTTVKPKTG